MHSTMPENVAEHTLMTAVLAHALAVIGTEIFNKNTNPDACAVRALYHDSTEIFTGDMPTPVKYLNATLRNAYLKAEENGAEKLLSGLPEKLKRVYSPLVTGEEHDGTERYVYAADKISAHIKCLEELKAGNAEFRRATVTTFEKVKALDMEEVEFFISEFLPSFSLTLDELE